MERLQKYMAAAGAGSRRQCEKWIEEGLVTVNGETVTELGTKIEPGRDEVLFRGKKLEPQSDKITVMLNKPAGYVTTAHDQFGRPGVCDLIELPGVRLYPIGRLDYQTTGLLLLTNDGELANELTHPGAHIPKVYRALVRGRVTSEEIKKLENGVTLDDGYLTQKAKARLVSLNGRNSTIELTLYEGKNRQVRRMGDAIGHPVIKLARLSEGGLELGTLKEGEWRKLTDKEIRSLKNCK